MPYVTFVPQAPMGESADPGIFVQGTHVPAPLVERSGITGFPPATRRFGWWWMMED